MFFFYYFDDEMKNGEIAAYSEQTFEDIKHYTEDGEEFWYARDLQRVLGYTEWRNFTSVIEKAKVACQNSGIDPAGDFFLGKKKIKAF